MILDVLYLLVLIILFILPELKEKLLIVIFLTLVTMVCFFLLLYCPVIIFAVPATNKQRNPPSETLISPSNNPAVQYSLG